MLLNDDADLSNMEKIVRELAAPRASFGNLPSRFVIVERDNKLWPEEIKANNDNQRTVTGRFKGKNELFRYD